MSAPNLLPKTALSPSAQFLWSSSFCNKFPIFQNSPAQIRKASTNFATRRKLQLEEDSSVKLQRRNISSSQVKMSKILENLLAKNPKLKCQNREKVETALQKMVQGGPDTLQVIADFDYTLTRVHKDGKTIDCSWGVMENSSILPQDYIDKTDTLRTKYLAYERDPKLAISEKIPYMVEWYTEANKLLKEYAINRNLFPKMVQSSNVDFRDDTGDFFRSLADRGVPVLILSAGLGDLVVEILKQFSLMTPTVKVVSNFCAFDAEGNVTGIDGEMIHVFNKSESAIHGSPYFSQVVKSRRNVILLGDSLGDLQMAEGVENPDSVLKIGFLNHHLEEKLADYMESFDLVLLDDQTMDVPFDIVKEILNNNASAKTNGSDK